MAGRPGTRARAVPIGIRIGLRMKTGFLVLVIPGPDPGIALTTEFAWILGSGPGMTMKGRWVMKARCVRPNPYPAAPLS
jgi:hypothetical protein